MPKYSTSISINANQETVWKILSDVARWHEWTPTVTKVEVIDQSELKLNHHYKVYQPKLQPAVWTVTVLTPPSSFIWESRMPGMLMIAEHTLKPMNSNQTELSLKFAFQGWLGEIFGRMYRKISESYLATEAQSLKKRVENS
jgi:ribosome-associated toxin RatA of RatAB toxin-antitoxin module